MLKCCTFTRDVYKKYKLSLFYPLSAIKRNHSKTIGRFPSLVNINTYASLTFDISFHSGFIALKDRQSNGNGKL